MSAFHRPDSPAFRVQRVEKPWGYEILWAWGGGYAGKTLHVNAGEALSLQYHEHKDETLSVLTGRVRVDIGRDASSMVTHIMEPGDCLRIEPGDRHRLIAELDSDVLEASTDHLGDVVRLDDRYGRVP